MKFPTRGVTDLSIFHPFMLGIKPPSQVYLEGHAGNFLNMKVRGDPVVQEALSVALAREEVWSRKSSTICECREIFIEVEESNFVPTELNTYNCQTASRIALPNLKKATNQIVARKFLNKYNDQAEDLTFQGEFIKLLHDEQQDITWKSYIYAVPRGVMSRIVEGKSRAEALLNPGLLVCCRTL